jgi:flagellar biosynthesis protein FliR
VTTERTAWFVLIVATGVLWAFYGLDVDSPLRAMVAVAYLLIAPGWAVVNLLDLAQRWAAALLSVAVSLGIVTIVATALLVLNLWTTGRALAIVGSLTLLAAGARLVITSGSAVTVTAGSVNMERREDGS